MGRHPRPAAPSKGHLIVTPDSRGHNGGNWTTATAAGLAAVGAPTTFFVLDPSSVNPSVGIVGISCVILLWASIHLATLIASGRPRITALTVWMFVYISGAVVPLAQAHSNLYPWLMDQRFIVSAQLMILVFCFGIELGNFRRWMPNRQDRQNIRVVDARAQYGLTFAAILATTLYIIKMGGPATFFQSRWALADAFAHAGLRNDSQVGSAIFNTVGTIPILLAWIIWTIKLGRQTKARNFTSYCCWLTLFALNTVVNNPISNARYWVLAVFAGLVFSRPRLRPATIRVAIIGGIACALVAFPYADYFRTGKETGPLATESIEQKISTKDYDQSIMTANGVWWVENHGHTLGRQVAGAALFWVPRSMWTEKPSDTGVLIGRAMDTGNINLSSPLWLELWIDFSWIGVLLAGIGVGQLSRRLDDRFVETRSEHRQEILIEDFLIPVLAGYAFIVLRGPLLQSMSRLSVIVVVAVVVTRRTIKSASDSGDPEPASRPSGRPDVPAGVFH